MEDMLSKLSIKDRLEILVTNLDEKMFKEYDVNGPVCKSWCKLTAEECFQVGNLEGGVYYLCESHAIPLRLECLYQYGFNKIRNKLETQAALNEKYLSFKEKYTADKYEGVLSRLKELPKEWTLLQLTQKYDPKRRWKSKLPDVASEMTDLHLVRYKCGKSSSFCHVSIPKPRSDLDGTQTILELLHSATMAKEVHMRGPSNLIKKNRIINCSQLKIVVNEISTSWLGQWRCFFLGKLRNVEMENNIRAKIDDVFLRSNCDISANEKLIVHQLANGCAYLKNEEIENAVSQLVRDFALEADLVDAILQIKSYNSANEERYPVILIVDEKLECVPWEMISTLRKHPVSRMPSVHFVHALFKKYEESVVDGNITFTNLNPAFYMINPDQSLKTTEKRMLEFLKIRFPEWHGTAGVSPSKNEFISALRDNNIFLYCGHGNGTQYLGSTDLNEINVKAISLLFGCSSLQYKNFGSHTNLISLSHNYLIAGSPCVLGMLWSITSNDADCMALTLLNHWLPGIAVPLKEGFQYEITLPDLSYKEPELLRAVATARKSAVLYTNSTAMVAYGLPVKVI